MAVEVTCQCGESFLAPEKAGARVKCPHCGLKFALRELYETGAGDLTPLPPEPVSPLPPEQLSLLPAAHGLSIKPALIPPAGGASSAAPAPASVLQDRRTSAAAKEKPFWLTPLGGAAIGGAGAVVLIVAALTWQSYAREHAQETMDAARVQWREYASQEGRFAVLLPDGYEASDGQSELDGKQVPINAVEATSPDRSVLQATSYHVTPPLTMQERQDALDAYCDHLLEKQQQLSRRAITIDDNPGRELVYEERLDLMTDVVRVRVYSVGGRLLKLSSRRMKSASPAGDADKFFQSLRILDAA